MRAIAGISTSASKPSVRSSAESIISQCAPGTAARRNCSTAPKPVPATTILIATLNPQFLLRQIADSATSPQQAVDNSQPALLLSYLPRQSEGEKIRKAAIFSQDVERNGTV